MAGKIKFVKRGQALAATIQEDDLAAHEWGSEVPNQVDKVRAQDLELPHEVNVLYINSGADYQQGTQKSERQTGSGLSVMSIPLPVVMSDTKAKQVADVNHYNAWVGRTTYTLQLSRKWSKLEPTDVIDVVYGATTFRMRITKKDDSKGIIKLECVAEDSAIYSQSGLGAGVSNIPTQVVTIPVQTLGMFLDIPMLRDLDNDAGIYFAACGYRAGWDGCAVFKSTDGGSTYAQVTSTNDESTIGYAKTELGDFYGGNMFDETNTVTVQIISGTLSSASELLVLNNANYAVLGSELIQFKNAELVSAGVYKLSGLLRGRKGTEWAMSAHNVGDRFVLANVINWRRILLQTSEIGLNRLYKLPTFGTTLQQAPANPFQANGVSLECYSPVLAGIGRNTTNDMIINWTRRTRISGEWRDYVEVPLGEDSQSYEIDILDVDGVTVKSTLTSTTNTVTYTAAQQVTDFERLLDSVNVSIYQMSSIVGRGYPLTKLLQLNNLDRSSTRWRLYITSGNSITVAVNELQMFTEIGGTDVCVGGTASASLFSANAFRAFDGDNASEWTLTLQPYPQWLEYTFLTPVNIVQWSYYINFFGRGANDFNLQYYDGATWQNASVIKNQTWSDGETKIYTI